MEIASSILSWILTGSIYGAFIVAAVVIVLVAGIMKIIPSSQDPAILGVIGVITFGLAVFTLPSIPRYQFERQALSNIEGKEWIRVVNKTGWGSVTEPLTWFATPIGSMYIVMPNNPIEGGYQEVLLRYEEDAQVTIAYPSCNDKTILRARPDNEGVFRYTSTDPKSMNEQDISTYCEYDWSKEKSALRREILKQIEPEGNR